jgi:hypothetical protein
LALSFWFRAAYKAFGAVGGEIGMILPQVLKQQASKSWLNGRVYLCFGTTPVFHKGIAGLTNGFQWQNYFLISNLLTKIS